MKMLMTIILVLFACANAVASTLKVRAVQDTIRVAGGETAPIPLIIEVPAGFDATLFISLVAPTLSAEKPEAIPSAINPPYKNALVKVKTIAGYTKGVHQIIITAKNAPLEASDTCYLVVLESTRWKVFPGKGPAMPRWIVQDRQDHYWYCPYGLGVGGHGVYRLSANLEDTVLFSFSNPAVPGIAYESVFDKRNRAWFAGGGSLHRYDGEFWSKYTPENSSLPEQTVETVAIDSSDNVWAGTRKGLVRLSGSEWTVFDQSNSVLGVEVIHDVEVDPQGNVWVATAKGLARFDGQNWTRYNRGNSNIPSDFVWRIAAESDTAVWLGMGAQSTEYVWPYNEPKSMIGLARFNGIIFSHYHMSNSEIPSNYVRSIAIDKRGNKWLATTPLATSDIKSGTGVGLIKFDGSHWTLLDTTNSPMRNSHVSWVGVDNDNNIWIATGYSNAVFNEDGLSTQILTGLEDESEPVTTMAVFAPHPNPAERSTVLRYALTIISPLEIFLSDAMGQRVRTLLESPAHEPGDYTLAIDVSGLSSGIYYCTLRTERGSTTAPVVVVR